MKRYIKNNDRFRIFNFTRAESSRFTGSDGDFIMKHETEINYVKNRIKKLEMDFAAFASLLIQAGIVEIAEEDGQQVFRVKQVKFEDNT